MQGFIRFMRARAWKSVCVLLGGRAHVEAARIAVAAAKYCMKDGNYEEFGSKTAKIARKVARVKAKEKKPSVYAEVAEEIEGGMSLGEVVDKYPKMYFRYHTVIEKLIREHAPSKRQKPEVFWFVGKTGTGKSQQIEKEVSESVYWHSGNYKW